MLFSVPLYAGTRWLFFIVFDVLYAEGEGEEDKARVDEVIREAARSSRAPCAPGTLLKGGNITVGYGFSMLVFSVGENLPLCC